MVQLSEEVERLIIKAGNVVFVGSVDAKGVPNISPRFVLDIVGNEKLLFGDSFQSKTLDNLKAWNKVTVAIIDHETMGGFQLKGDVLEVTDESLIKEGSQKLKEFGFNHSPRRIWTLEVKEIYSLKPSDESKPPLISAYG
ncbi:MAG: pyridoxamine 5'-phosphate oxidase family protein [Thaumarchaeota archaeon]|nr:pyridoxamine 5'-phosphate oxidase family protein [Nitrososphaerota archaeon]